MIDAIFGAPFSDLFGMDYIFCYIIKYYDVILHTLCLQEIIERYLASGHSSMVKRTSRVASVRPLIPKGWSSNPRGSLVMCVQHSDSTPLSYIPRVTRVMMCGVM